MPSSRRMRVTGLVALLTVFVIFYITHGARSTYNSQFYTRTVEALKTRQDAQARQDMIEKEKSQLDRVKQLQREHNAAVSAKASEETATAKVDGGAGRAAVAGANDQKPLAADVKDAIDDGNVVPVAGRRTMKDSSQKIVKTRPTGDSNDGVAKVGNVDARPTKPSSLTDSEPETEEEHEVEVELDTILKKGPIIVFSKSYCRFSKKAKHILQDLYTIKPPPYVVELDQHPLGPGLQHALQRSTLRRTVPNILVNGKSIGGGDDIEALHNNGELIEKITSMVGKRVEIKKNDGGAKTEVKFKA
ncbi:Glutaredoxin [Teratosphaeria destructans]|uniref:Glutaredoxin n=1 Tax=Teratosphaeria destructans TaxID=418781 RepID=A0A9W7W099_9PEZI|nr:Glutaredoxin [Teratosphaeria destructans]